MAALRRACYLGLKANPKKIENVPEFPHLTEAPPRAGFVDESKYRKLVAQIPATELWLRALLAVAYNYGFRKGELLKLRVGQIDLLDRAIRLNPGETKSGKGRLVPLAPDAFLLLQALVVGKTGNDSVFARSDGSPVRDFRDAWATLCKTAGLPGLLFHDLRRSAVRNMIRRGVSQKVAMQISGHETPSVFERYDITDETDLRAAVDKIQAGQKIEQAALGHQTGIMEGADEAARLSSVPVNKLTN
jgi:integrase